jgi:uncharacterized membrane protein (UPF0127 family)
MWQRECLSGGWPFGPLSDAGPLVNWRTGAVLATKVTIAADRATRRRGLLGRAGIGENEALVLVPCFAIHTWRMRFPIDVLFLDTAGRVIDARSRLLPGKVAAALGAHAVIELATGRIAATGTRKGDELGRLQVEYGRV